MSLPHTATPALRTLPCQVAGARLALELTDLLAIHRADGLQRNPATTGPVGWLLDYREIPILDLGEWLGLRTRSIDPAAAPSSRILVFGRGETARGLLVDASGQARDIEDTEITPLAAVLGGLRQRGLRGVLAAQGYPWLVLDPAVPSFDTRTTNPEANDTAAPPKRSDVGQPSAAPTPLPPPPPWLDPVADVVEPEEEAVTPGSDAPGRLLLFGTSAGEARSRPIRFGLSVTQVLEVLALPEVGPVPGAPAHVRGLTLWRGRPLVVLDLDRRLGWPAGEAPVDRMIVIQTTDGEIYGLASVGALRFLQLPVDHRPGVLPASENGATPEPCALGVFELEGETLVLPDLQRLTAGAP